MSYAHSLTVLIFNDSLDQLETLQRWFQAHGHRAITVQLSLTRGAADMPKKLLEEHRPDAAVFDIGIPYLSNWDFLAALRVSHLFNGTPVVVTTGNKAALERLVGPTEALEVIGLHEDLDAILAAVEVAAKNSQA